MQRLSQHKIAVDNIYQSQSSCRIKRRFGSELTQESSEHWTQHKSATESCPYQPKALCSDLRRCNIRDVGVTQGKSGAGNTGYQASNKEPR